MGRPKKEIKKSDTPISINLIKEIISILGETEKKVKIMQDCSQKDFSFQNRHLKQHFSKIKEIFDNSVIMSDLLSKSNSKNLSGEITEFQIYISSKSESFNKRYKHHLKLVEEIRGRTVQIQHPLEEYKKNTSTLKQLVTKFKKTFVYSKDNDRLEDPNIVAIEGLITKMDTTFPLINESIKNLKTLADKLTDDLNKINKKNLTNFSDLLYKLSLTNMEISGMVDEKTSQIPGLNDTIKLCFKNIDYILINLQYQDIIRQQLDHMKNIQFKIVSDLKEAEKTDDYNVELINYKFGSRIPEIAELQAAQFLYTNNEYKNVIEKIKNKFAEIAEFLNSYTDASSQFLNAYIRLDKDILNDINSRLDDYTNAYEEFIKFKKNYAKDLKEIDSISDNIYGYFTTLNSINANIEQLTFNIIKRHFNSKDQKDINYFSQQFATVSSDNNKELHSIQYIYTGIQKNSKYLVLSIDNTRADVLMLKTKKEFFESVNKNFTLISKEYPEIKKILQKNITLSETIAKEIIPSYDNSNIYETFTKITEELLFNLNHIFKQLMSENININQIKRDLIISNKGKRNLTPSEKAYQNRTLNKLKGKNQYNCNLFSKSKKDIEIELF